MRKRVSDPLRADGVNLAMTANEKGMMLTSGIVAVHAGAAGPLTVAHDLGEIPDDFQYSRLDNTSVGLYATESQRTSWTANFCNLTASADGNFRVWFVKRIA